MHTSLPDPARRPFVRVLVVAALCFAAHSLPAQVVFNEKFDKDLSQWTSGGGRPFYGKIVKDPLQADSALSFSKVNHSGDTWTKTRFPTGTYSLAFDYLGRALRGSAPGDMGGFVAVTGVGWVAGTYCAAARSCILIDDGKWRRYVVRFWASSSFQVVFQDWDGAGHSSRLPGVAGDVFFDNVELSRDVVFGTTSYGDSSPGCTGTLAIAATSTPLVGNSFFAVACSNAPPKASGILGLTLEELTSPIRFSGITVWINPVPLAAYLGAGSSSSGKSRVSLPIPQISGLSGFRFYAQFVWSGPTTPSPCPPHGVSASHALEITIQ